MQPSAREINEAASVIHFMYSIPTKDPEKIAESENILLNVSALQMLELSFAFTGGDFKTICSAIDKVKKKQERGYW